MEYKEFLEFIKRYRKLEKQFSELHNMGFDFYEGKYPLSEEIYKLLDIFLNSHFTEEGVDWVNWFIFENEYGEKDWSKMKYFDNKTEKTIEAYGAKDEEGNPICYSYESTFEYVKQYLK